MEYSADFFESIENRNKEYNALFYGAEYNKGIQVNNLIKAVKGLAIKELIDAVQYKLVSKKFQKYNVREREKLTLDTESTYESYVKLRNKKIAVYTCISGGYDYLKEPLLVFDNVEYICFTDDASKLKKNSNTKWHIKPIPESINKKYDKTLANRYIKMHPHEIFPDYDYSIYADGNISIASFLGTYLTKTNVKTGMAIFAHSQRRCAYAEAEVCIGRKKGNKKAIKRQMQKYHEAGFPENYGLYECTIIATDLNNHISKEIMGEWWKEFLDSKSLRDQLSLPYLVWKKGYGYTDVGILGNSIFQECKVTVYGH